MSTFGEPSPPVLTGFGRVEDVAGPQHGVDVVLLGRPSRIVFATSSRARASRRRSSGSNWADSQPEVQIGGVEQLQHADSRDLERDVEHARHLRLAVAAREQALAPLRGTRRRRRPRARDLLLELVALLDQRLAVLVVRGLAGLNAERLRLRRCCSSSICVFSLASLRRMIRT